MSELIIQKPVSISRVQTMADRGVRLVIDLLGGDGHDMEIAYKLMDTDTIMILTASENLTDEFEGDMGRVEELSATEPTD